MSADEKTPFLSRPGRLCDPLKSENSVTRRPLAGLSARFLRDKICLYRFRLSGILLILLSKSTVGGFTDTV